MTCDLCGETCPAERLAEVSCRFTNRQICPFCREAVQALACPDPAPALLPHTWERVAETTFRCTTCGVQILHLFREEPPGKGCPHTYIVGTPADR